MVPMTEEQRVAALAAAVAAGHPYLPQVAGGEWWRSGGGRGSPWPGSGNRGPLAGAPRVSEAWSGPSTSGKRKASGEGAPSGGRGAAEAGAKAPPQAGLRPSERLEACISSMMRSAELNHPSREEQILQKQQILEELQRVERELQVGAEGGAAAAPCTPPARLRLHAIGDVHVTRLALRRVDKVTGLLLRMPAWPRRLLLRLLPLFLLLGRVLCVNLLGFSRGGFLARSGSLGLLRWRVSSATAGPLSLRPARVTWLPRMTAPECFLSSLLWHAH